MKFSPHNCLTRFVNSNCLDCTLPSILKELGIIKAETIAFSNPIFSELKRNYFSSLHISFFILDIFSFCLFLKLHLELHLSLFIVIVLIADFEFSGIKLFMILQEVFYFLLKFVSFGLLDNFFSDSIFFNLFLLILQGLNLLFKTVYLC